MLFRVGSMRCTVTAALSGVLTSTAAVPQFANAAALGASVPVAVEVPSGAATAPFDVSRILTVPPDFRISVLARIPGARFMAVAPNGDVLVSQPYSGIIKLVQTDADGIATVSDYATGLRFPHDIVFHEVGSETFVYIGESHQISRVAYHNGDRTAGAKQVLVAGLPNSSSPELKGAYGHQLKNIAVDRSHNLYVSIASATNAAVSDALSDPVRCAIYRYAYQPERAADQPYSSGQLLARGLRNAEGLAFVPGTDDLWVVVNNRDKIPYPYHGDINGDGLDDYGSVIQGYVDDHPPEEFIHVREGADYGWPYANPRPGNTGGMDDIPFDPDYDNNRDWTVYPEASFTRVDKGIQAHSSPLGLSFLQGTALPVSYREGAAIALHGSWNRAVKSGYKVIYFPWQTDTGRPGDEMDLITGWVDRVGQQAWGRPVDVVPDQAGNLLISDDMAGAIYKLSYAPPLPPPPVEDEPRAVMSFTLVDTSTGLDVTGYEAITAGTIEINRSRLPELYSLRANVAGHIGSVWFQYNSSDRYRVENVSPFCVKGDPNKPGSTCFDWLDGMAPGTHTITATPYSEAWGTGEPGRPLTVTLQISPAIAVSSFALTDVPRGLDLPGYADIPGGRLVIDRSTLPAAYALRAKVSGTVGSVLFEYNGKASYKTENIAPYCIRGDDAAAATGCFEWLEGMSPGIHRVTATPYTEAWGKGLPGVPQDLILEIR